MPGLFSDRILLVDLSQGEVDEKGCGDEFLQENIGGAKANLALYRQYENENPIVIGCGPFSGTLFPGGAVIIVTAKSPINGEIVHTPIILNSGMEFKLTGFDFAVIKGKSEEPAYLWLHDEIGDLHNAAELWGKSPWEVTDKLRSDMGDPLVQVLSIGIAGENGSKAAQLCYNYWGTPDKANIAAAFAEKNLKAVAFRGLGLVEIESPDEFVDGCAELKRSIIDGNISGKKGIASIAESLGASEIPSWLSPSVHRLVGCFGCPMNCNTFVKYNEAPSELSQNGVDEPGFLITDTASLIKLQKAGFSSTEAGKVLEYASRLGIEPVQTAKAIEGKGSTFDEVKDTITALSESSVEVGNPFEDAWGESKSSPYSAWSPLKGLFEGNADANVDEANSIAYTLGICPVLMLASPEITAEKIAELLNLGVGIEKSADEIKSISL
ncbi:MAG: hypothetical protein D6734_05295 [Candidatus Schekmanbacteria bacterium]|nr:MAG: hypothetical protein D6734_05295 [Candidatus Schekmanbacteria bacterium]